MKLPLLVVGLALFALSGCSSGGGSGSNASGGNGGGGAIAVGGSGGSAPGGSGGTVSSGGSGGTGGSAGTTALSINCGTPSLVVVRDAGGEAGKSVTIARVPLQLNQAVTGLALTSVKQIDGGGKPVRDWKASDFKGPPGFDGSVSASSTLEYKVSLWAETASDATETAACDLKPWERGGKLTVQGATNEGGSFEVECSLGTIYNGVGPEPRRFTCAKGIPGWLYEQTGISNVTTPVVIGIAQAGIHILNDSNVDWNGFSANGATLYSYFASDFAKPCSSPPDHFDFPAGMHQLWNGGSSQDTWTGPVAAGATESANWMWQLQGMQFPAGFCFKPDPNPPTDPSQMCQEPVLSITLSGTSSAGAWEWESDLFQCYDLSGT